MAKNLKMKYCTFNKRYLKMLRVGLYILFCCITTICYSQRDSLKLGDRYAEDQIYASVSYAQFYNQPSQISKSDFSFSLSTGFIKDIILNNRGNFSLALGVGYGLDSFNHKLKIAEVNNAIVFSADNTITNNLLQLHNIEIPFQIRWRTSTAQKYNFWRIYTGVKLLYNLSNTFKYLDANDTSFLLKNIPNYNKIQYGLTFSAGYDEFNINVFYGVSPILNNAFINNEPINTRILKFGLIFFLL